MFDTGSISTELQYLNNIEIKALRVIMLAVSATSENVHRTCVPREDSDQTAHSRSLIRIFSGCILDS